MKCSRCGSDYDDDYFKDEEGNIICGDCLLDLEDVTSETTFTYYIDGEYIGNSDNYDEVYKEICDNFDYQKV